DAAPWADQEHRPGQDRSRRHEAHPARRMDRVQPALDPARAPDLRGARAAGPGVCAERLLPLLDGEGEGPAAALDTDPPRGKVGPWPIVKYRASRAARRW